MKIDEERPTTIDAKRARGKRTQTRHKNSLRKNSVSFFLAVFSPALFDKNEIKKCLSSLCFPWIFLRRKKERKKYTRERKKKEPKTNRKISLLQIIDHHRSLPASFRGDDAENALLERVGASFGGVVRDDEDGERERDVDSNGTRITYVPHETFEHHVVLDHKTSAVRARVRMAGDWMRVRRRERVQDFVRVVLRFGFSRGATSRWFAA